MRARRVKQRTNSMAAIEDAAASLGAAISERTQLLAGAESLGPPDLCYLFVQRSPSGGLLPSLRGLVLGSAAAEDSSGPITTGVYHHVIGLDVSSPAPVAGYVADRAAEQSAASGLSAIYCCWDAFAREDLRVLVSIPGGVSASVVRRLPGGRTVEAPTEAHTWQRVAMSGLLRALCPLPAMPDLLSLPPSLPPEDDFLAAARDFLLAAAAVDDDVALQSPLESAAVGSASDLSGGGGGSGGGASAPLIAAAVYCYFSHSFRFEQAVNFFLPLATRLGCCAERAAAAQRELGQLPEAILTLAAALQSHPADQGLLTAQGELLLQCHMLDAALKVASHGARLGPTRRRTWLLLARAQLAKGLRVDAMRTLNAAPVRVLIEPTLPRACPLRGAPTTADPAMPDAALGGGAEGGIGSAEAAPDDAQAVETRWLAYGVLSEMLRSLGWQQLLQLRGEAFAMEGEPERGEAAAPGGAASELSERAGSDRIGSARKPLCHAWLDELFVQLHTDLVAMDAWRVEDDGESAAQDGAADAADAADAAGASDDQKWLRRARLAERLLLPAEARTAYTRTVQALELMLDGTEAEAPAEGDVRVAAERLWAEACTTLMRLHAAGDDDGASITEALAAAHRLLDESTSSQASATAPREVTACIYQLVSVHGLQHVRAAQRSIGEAHPALNHIFHEVVERKVLGYDR